MAVTMTVQPIILGGGLAGLSACYHGNGVVYEKDSSPGGHARSHSANGFVFDEGIHVLHTTNKYVLSLMEEIKADLILKDRNAWIMSNGAMTRYPFQANTYGLPVDIVKECLIGFVQNEFDDPDKIKNYEDWLYYMFGKGITERFMIPYSKKFWGVEPRELTTEWVNIRHPRPSLDEVISGALQDQTKGFGVNARFRYPSEGGFGNVAEALARQCRDRVQLGMRATRIDVKNREIEFNGEECRRYEKIISTLRLPDVIKIITDAPDDVREAASKLRTNSLFVVNVGVDRENISDKSWIYFLEKEFSFVRVSFPFNFSNAVTPDGTSSISAEVAYGNGNSLPTSKDKIADRVLDDLVKAKLLFKEDKIIHVNTIDVKYGYVIFDKSRKPAVNVIHRFLKEKGIVPCGRYGMWGYLWSDEAILSGKKAAEALLRDPP